MGAPPLEQSSFISNFGNAFEAATEGAVKATVHRVKVHRADLLAASICHFQASIFDTLLSRTTIGREGAGRNLN